MDLNIEQLESNLREAKDNWLLSFERDEFDACDLLIEEAREIKKLLMNIKRKSH